MDQIAKNILKAQGFPRFAESGKQRDLWIDQAFQMLTGYRSARIAGGQRLHENRNVLHVTMPWMRQQIALKS